MIFPETVFDRLIEHSVPEPGPLATPCWVWQKGRCNKGYGFIYFYCEHTTRTGKGLGHRKGKSKGIRAHIASWVIANGPVPAGMTLDHLCRNTGCIRPSHLEPVTRPENTRRANAVNVIKRHTARSTAVVFTRKSRSRPPKPERRQRSKRTGLSTGPNHIGVG